MSGFQKTFRRPNSLFFSACCHRGASARALYFSSLCVWGRRLSTGTDLWSSFLPAGRDTAHLSNSATCTHMHVRRLMHTQSGGEGLAIMPSSAHRLSPLNSFFFFLSLFVIDFIPHETERFIRIGVECSTVESQLLLNGDKNLEFNLSNCQETSIVYRCRSCVLLFLNLDARGLWTMKPTAPGGRPRHAAFRFSCRRYSRQQPEWSHSFVSVEPTERNCGLQRRLKMLIKPR